MSLRSSSLFIKSYCLLVTGLILIGTSGCGKKSSPTLKAYERPLAVLELKAERFEDLLTVSWNYPANERRRLKGFLLTKESEGKTEQFILPPETTQVREGLIVGKGRLTYHVKAVNHKDIEGPSTVLSVNLCPMPEPPKTLSLKIHPDALEILWEQSKIHDRQTEFCGTILYNLYRSDNPEGNQFALVNEKPLQTTSFRLPVEMKKTYYYAVRPLLKNGILQIGRLSNLIKSSPEDLIPSEVTLIHKFTKDGMVYLLWHESQESWVRGYRIYRKTEDEPFKLHAETSTPVLTDFIGDIKKVAYRITALGPEREGKPIEVVIDNE